MGSARRVTGAIKRSNDGTAHGIPPPLCGRPPRSAVVFIACKAPVDPVALVVRHVANVRRTGVAGTRSVPPPSPPRPHAARRRRIKPHARFRSPEPPPLFFSRIAHPRLRAHTVSLQPSFCRPAGTCTASCPSPRRASRTSPTSRRSAARSSPRRRSLPPTARHGPSACVLFPPRPAGVARSGRRARSRSAPVAGTPHSLISITPFTHGLFYFDYSLSCAPARLAPGRACR